MKCPKSRLSSLPVIVLAIFICSSLAHAGERDDLYEAGIKAYDSKDYVSALKNLHTFYVLNEKSIDANPDFKKKILDRISNAESILKLAFAASPSVLESNGRIRIITRQNGGSFVGTGKEIEGLLNNKTIDLESIQEVNRKALTNSYNGR